MNRTQAVEITRLVKALCPGQPIDAFTPDAWAIVLDDIDVDEAKTAIRRIYRELGNDEEWGARRIEADDIIREVKRRHREILARHADELIPPAGISQPDERIWLREARRRLIAGLPVPDNGRAIGTRSLPALTRGNPA